MGLSEAGPCVAVGVRGVDNVTIFLHPCLSNVALECFIADVAVVVVIVSTVVVVGPRQVDV